MEGWIPKIFVEHQRTHLAHTDMRMTAKRRARGLVTRLLQITNKQWLLQNAKVHIKRKGDLTAEKHDKLLTNLEKLVWTNPDDLLPGDQHLLDKDIDMLGARKSQRPRSTTVGGRDGSLNIRKKKHENPKQKNTKADKTQHPSNNDETITTKQLKLTNELGSEGSGAW